MKRGADAIREARSALSTGDHASAEAKVREAQAMGFDDAATWTLLGASLRARDPVASAAALRTALERDPRFADAHFHAGNLHREERRYADAIVAYTRALQLVPGQPSVLTNLGLACVGASELQRAEACYREVLEGHPNHRQALGNLAHLFCRTRRYDAALPLCERYLDSFPDADATVWVDHGICIQHHLRDAGRAEASYRRALVLAPDDPTCLVNLGSLLIDRGDFDGADDLLSRATGEGPMWLYASTLLALSRQHRCAWDGLADLHARIAERIRTSQPEDQLANPLATLSMPLAAAAQHQVAQHWARTWQSSNRAPFKPVARPRAPGERIRLGYVSSDLRSHAVAFLLCEVWERHDRERFTTTAYSLGPREDSALRRRIEGAFDRFVDVHDESPERTAERVRDDGIDILVDLNGYTRGSRTAIFALRPAPVQISWLGYLGTLGASWIDYVITDTFCAPDALQAAFTERFLHLPDCYCPSDMRREIAKAAGTRADAGLPEQGFVFCCFNNTYKILPAVFEVWMRLLARVPQSVLWLSPGSAAAAANLRREAVRRGIDPARLVYAPHVPLPLHLARHAHADLYLDTWPHGAGTTANDALLMGLPVLTVAGETMASRAAGSQVRAAGLSELVTFNPDDYEALALSLAKDPAAVARLKSTLRECRRTSPLFDMARFTRNLEAALASVVR